MSGCLIVLVLLGITALFPPIGVGILVVLALVALVKAVRR